MSHVNVFVSAICHDGKGKILMGKRGNKARDRHGEWEFGGGTLEVGETLEQALCRETYEEYGAVPFNIIKIDTLEFRRPSGYWLGIFFVAQIDPGQVYIAEPVYDEIGWFSPTTLPDPVFENAHELLTKAQSYIH